MNMMATYRKSRVQDTPCSSLAGRCCLLAFFILNHRDLWAARSVLTRHRSPESPSMLGCFPEVRPALTGSEERPGSLCAAGGLKLGGKWGLDKVVGS